MFGNLGMTELLMLLVICLVLFGAKRLPEMGASIGKGIKEFKRGVSDIASDSTSEVRQHAELPRQQEFDRAVDTDADRAPRRLFDA
jgi:sec-independent protein translocase protein TatA